MDCPFTLGLASLCSCCTMTILFFYLLSSLSLSTSLSVWHERHFLLIKWSFSFPAHFTTEHQSVSFFFFNFGYNKVGEPFRRMADIKHEQSACLRVHTRTNTHTRQCSQGRDRRQSATTNAAFLYSRGWRLCEGCAQAPVQSVGSHERCSHPTHQSWLFSRTSNQKRLNKYYRSDTSISMMTCRATRKLFNMKKMSMLTKKCTDKNNFSWETI